MRRRVLAFPLLVTAFMAGCMSDRARPDPVTIHEQPLLTAFVNKPHNNETVLSLHPVDIQVFGSEIEHNTLTGVGFVVRRNGQTVDSAAVQFAEQRDSTVTFTFDVPDFPTNTHLAIFGLAFGPEATFVVSEARLVTVIRCAPEIQGC